MTALTLPGFLEAILGREATRQLAVGIVSSGASSWAFGDDEVVPALEVINNNLTRID